MYGILARAFVIRPLKMSLALIFKARALKSTTRIVLCQEFQFTVRRVLRYEGTHSNATLLSETFDEVVVYVTENPINPPETGEIGYQ